MKLLFLRSQLVDIEFGVRNGADFGDVQPPFRRDVREPAGCGERAPERRPLVPDSWGPDALGAAGGSGATRPSASVILVFERASRAGLEGHGRETCENFESSGERRCRRSGREASGEER